MEWHELPKYNGIQVSQLIYPRNCNLQFNGHDFLRKDFKMLLKFNIVFKLLTSSNTQQSKIIIWKAQGVPQ